MTKTLSYDIGGDEIPVEVKNTKTGEIMKFELRNMSDAQHDAWINKQQGRVDMVTKMPKDLTKAPYDILLLTLYDLETNAYVTPAKLALIPHKIQAQLQDEAERLNGVDAATIKKRMAVTS